MRRWFHLLLWLVTLGCIALVMGGAWWFSRFEGRDIHVTLESSLLDGPRDPLILHFSEAVNAKSFATAIRLDPAVPLDVLWTDFGQTLILTPEQDWQLETEYRLFVGAGRTRWYFPTSPVAFTLTGPHLPVVTAIMPQDGASDLVLGVEDPLTVTFERSVREFYIDFRLEPEARVFYQNNPEKTRFEILPQDTLVPGQNYTLSLFAKYRHAPDSEFQKIAVTHFSLLPPPPTTWSRDLAERTREAERFTRAKKNVGKYIDINLTSQVMTLFEEGKAVDAYVVSSGKRGMETPRGQFAIANKAARPWSKQYSLYMPYWMALVADGKFGIHELPEWPGGYKEGANHLGTPVSHGCVRLGVGAAKRVYEWADVGTPVVIY